MHYWFEVQTWFDILFEANVLKLKSIDVIRIRCMENQLNHFLLTTIIDMHGEDIKTQHII
jgi:hypothetical protein